MSDFFDDLEAQLRRAADKQARPGRRAWKRPALLLAVVAAIGAAAPALARVTGVWDPGVDPAGGLTPTAATQIATASRCAPPPAGDRTPSVTTRPVDPETAGVLGVLRRPRTTEDVLPALWTQHGLALGSVNPDTIRYVGSVRDTRYFVVPALALRSKDAGAGCPTWHWDRPVVCLFTANTSGGCTTPDAVRAQGTLGMTQIASGVSMVAGLVPDGVKAITVTIGPSQRTFAVTDNFFGYVVATDPQRPPDKIRWHMAEGTTRDPEPNG